MPTFKVKLLNSEGIIVDDKLESETELEAIAEIERRGMSLIEIKPVSTYLEMLTRKKVSKRELADFSKQLSYLIQTGIALHRGIEIIGEQVRNRYFKSVISQIVKDIREGVPLSTACSKHPKVFPESMVFQLLAAEEGGFMQETLVSIAQNFEREASFSKQVRGALIYPISVLVIAFGIVYFMLAFFVPKMAGTLKSFNATLPAITRMVMAASDIAKAYWYVVPIAIGVIIYAFHWFLQDDERKRIFHFGLLKIPVIGKLILNINIARFTRVLSSLLTSAVPMDDALDNVGKVLSNKYLSEEVRKIRQRVIEDGIPLSRSMEENPIFPKVLVQITRVGEESGSLEEVLKSLADKLEDDVSDLLKVTTSLINPFLMIFVGGIVGVIVMSIFLPMFSLMDTMQ